MEYSAGKSLATGLQLCLVDVQNTEHWPRKSQYFHVSTFWPYWSLTKYGCKDYENGLFSRFDESRVKNAQKLQKETETIKQVFTSSDWPVCDSLRRLLGFVGLVSMSLSRTSNNTTSSPSFGLRTASNSLFLASWSSSYWGWSWT